MLEMLIILFSIYTVIRIYASVMQIGYIVEQKKSPAVLMPDERYIESANYAIAKERFSLVSHFVEYLLFVWWVLVGFGFVYSYISVVQSPLMASVIFVLGYFVIEYIVSLPQGIYKTFVIDKKFGFTQTTPKLFIIDQIKGILIFLTLGIGAITLLVWIIESFDMWWFFGFVAVTAIVLVVNFAYPSIIAPIFNKFTSLEDLDLKEKIEKLMRDSGMEAKGVFVIDASKRDNRLNAYFGGFGKSKRVVMFDTLLSKLNHDELMAVLGHELGHFRHGDIWKNIFLMALLFFGAFFLLGHLPETLYEEIGVEAIGGVKLVLVSILFGLISFVWMPIISFFSRHNEYRADEYGSSVGTKKDLISALLKLVDENKSFPKSHPLYIFFYYSHPPILERLKRLGFEG
mgnify:CR=1 FL=1